MSLYAMSAKIHWGVKDQEDLEGHPTHLIAGGRDFIQ